MTGVSGQGKPPGRRLAVNLLVSLRVDQWTKNLIVFAGLVFGERLLQPIAVGRALGTFGIFCALSSAMYLINDLCDRGRDQLHPRKSSRPIAAGHVSATVALGLTAVLLAGSTLAGYFLESKIMLLVFGFVCLQLSYSLFLKSVVIVDVLTIAIGFVLRAVAGTVAIGVPISQWLLVCTLLLALFLALAKRRQEIVTLGRNAMRHRATLSCYRPELLDQMVGIVAASTLVSYSVYTISPATVEKFGTDLLTLTIPFPVYGVLRYLMLVHHQVSSAGPSNPSEVFLRDRSMAACVAGWILSIIFIIYQPFMP